MRAIRHFSTSSSFLIGLFFSSLVFAGIAFVAYFLVLANDDIFLRESEAAITAEMEKFIAIERSAGAEALVKALSERLQSSEHAYFYALRNAFGQPQLANLPYWPEATSASPPPHFIHFELDHQMFAHKTQSKRVMSEHYDVMALIHHFPDGRELLVGRNIDDLEIAQWVGKTFGWLMILLLVCISIVSFAVAYYVVSRINRIADTADRIIDTGNLSERLPVDNSWDDLSKLSISLNRMLSELEQQVAAIRTVSDNIAHDLRTPLTRIRSQIENVDAEELRHNLLQDVDALLGMFSGLLRIAEVENTKQRSAFAQNPLHHIIEDVVELYAPLMESKEQHYTQHLSHITAYCDRDLIFQAVANVLDNAVKFTPVGGHIHLSLHVASNDCVITIGDSGPGIAQHDLDKVTRRFFRAEESRTTPGFGLGMSLVSAIMKIHDGHVFLKHNASSAQSTGLLCELRFKYQPDDSLSHEVNNC